MGISTRESKNDFVPGWFADTSNGEFEIGIDTEEKHSGSASGYIQSVKVKADGFGNLCQWFEADKYCGKRFKLTGWVKTKLKSGSAQLWVRVDGDWESARRNSFDNMDDRPIKGATDWAPYSIVVEVPKSSTYIYFGCMLIGKGQVWLDDVTVEAVGNDVSLTGNFLGDEDSRKLQPINLDFAQLK